MKSTSFLSQNQNTIRKQSRIARMKRSCKMKAAELVQNNKFDNKIRRTIRSLIDTSPEFSRNPQNVGGGAFSSFSEVVTSNNPIFLRIARGTVLLACCSIFVFQVYATVSYYLSKPVVVDVKINEANFVQFPSISLGSHETAGAAHLFQEHNITFEEKMCTNIPSVILEEIGGIDTVEIWKMLNFTPSVTMASIVTRNQKYELTRHDDIAEFGTGLRFELDKFLPYEGLDSKLVIKTKKYFQQCSFMIIIASIQPPGMPSDVKTTLIIKMLTTIDLNVTTQKFDFVNRQAQVCVDDKDYFTCQHECSTNILTKLPCRFPFAPVKTELPSCISGRGMSILYKQVVMNFINLKCKCPRRCQETIYHISMRHIKDNKNETVINMYLPTNRIVIIAERFAYDFISLLSDTGGNLGLCLGLSILSSFEILQKVATFTMNIMNENNTRSTSSFNVDPIHCLVKRLLSKKLQQPHGETRNAKVSIVGVNYILNKDTPVIRRLSWFCVIVSCLTCSCLFIYIRGAAYWSVPTRMTVQIIHKDTVHFPNLTICDMALNILERLKNLATERNQFRNTSTNTSTEDWCSLQLTDLIDDPSITAEELWEESSVLMDYENSLEVGKMIFNRSFIENVFFQNVNLPKGKCVEINAGEQPFSGSNTKLARKFVPEAFAKYDEELKYCDRHYVTVFITPPGELLHISTYLYFPHGHRTLIMFEPKKITLWNTARKPCVAQGLAQKCNLQCFQKKLEKSVSCRLPYMPSALNNLPPCSSSKTARQTQEKYMELAVKIDQLQFEECGCIQSCERTIISSAAYFEPLPTPKSTYFSMYFFSNIYEHIVELPADSLSKLLCDIGGNLGLSLGVSVLSLFDVGQWVLRSLFKERKLTNTM